LRQEAGGPAVSVPTRKGFGSVILLDSAKQFGQIVSLQYRPAGLSYQLQIPLSIIHAPKKEERTAAVIDLRQG